MCSANVVFRYLVRLVLVQYSMPTNSASVQLMFLFIRFFCCLLCLVGHGRFGQLGQRMSDAALSSPIIPLTGASCLTFSSAMSAPSIMHLMAKCTLYWKYFMHSMCTCILYVAINSCMNNVIIKTYYEYFVKVCCLHIRNYGYSRSSSSRDKHNAGAARRTKFMWSNVLRWHVRERAIIVAFHRIDVALDASKLGA